MDGAISRYPIVERVSGEALAALLRDFVREKFCAEPLNRLTQSTVLPKPLAAAFARCSGAESPIAWMQGLKLRSAIARGQTFKSESEDSTRLEVLFFDPSGSPVACATFQRSRRGPWGLHSVGDVSTFWPGTLPSPASDSRNATDEADTLWVTQAAW